MEAQPVNPILDLRKFQLLLKREFALSAFEAKEVKDASKNMIAQYNKVLFYQKHLLILHMYSIDNIGLELPHPYFETISKVTPRKASDSADITAAPPEMLPFQKVITIFRNNPGIFAKSCVKLAQSNADLIDQLTFSTIPAVFSYLWNNEMMNYFIKFLKGVIEIDRNLAYKFGRVAFCLYAFREFFNATINKIEDKIISMYEDSDNQIPNVITEFVRQWDKKAEYCPWYIREILKLSDNPVDFLNQSYLQLAFTMPKIFMIIPPDTSITKERVNLITTEVCEKSSSLYQSLLNVKKPSSLYSSDALKEKMPEIFKTVLVSAKDADVLTKLIIYANQTNELSVPSVRTDLPLDRDHYVIYCIVSPEPEQQFIQTLKLCEEDDIELELRAILNEINDIPHAADALFPDFTELLKSQVKLSRSENRLHLTLKIADFEAAQKRSSKEWSFSDLTTLLKQKYDERANQRYAKLERISTFNSETFNLCVFASKLSSKIFASAQVFQYQLLEVWINGKDRPLDTVTAEICQSPQVFAQFFQNFTIRFREWLKNQNYSMNPHLSVFHNLIMKRIPLSVFVSQKRRLEKLDNNVYQTIRRHKNELVSSNSEKWMKHFIEKRELMDPAREILEKIVITKTPLPKLDYINIMQGKVLNIIQGEGIREIGADQLTPAIILLVVTTNPKNFASNIEYIKHFVFDARQYLESEFNFMKSDESYQFTMFNASLEHIKKIYPSIEQNIETE